MGSNTGGKHRETASPKQNRGPDHDSTPPLRDGFQTSHKVLRKHRAFGRGQSGGEEPARLDTGHGTRDRFRSPGGRVGGVGEAGGVRQGAGGVRHGAGGVRRRFRGRHSRLGNINRNKHRDLEGHGDLDSDRNRNRDDDRDGHSHSDVDDNW